MSFGSLSSRNSSDSGSSGSLAVDDTVVKHGTVYVKRIRSKGKIRFKAWQKRFLVLRDESAEENAHIDIYLSENHRDSEKISLDLAHVTSVEDYRESHQFPNAIIVRMDSGAPLLLGRDSQVEADHWRLAISLLMQKQRKFDKLQPETNEEVRPIIPQRRNHMDLSYTADDSRYHAVRVMTSEASARLSLAGDLFMTVTTSHILLSDVHNVTRSRWALLDVIKFKCEDDADDPFMQLLTLQAGISCGAREGVYKFRSKFGRILIKEVSQAYKKFTVPRDQELTPNKENVSPRISDANDSCEKYHLYLRLLPPTSYEPNTILENERNSQTSESQQQQSCSGTPPEDDIWKLTPAPPVPPPRPSHTLQ